MRENVVSSLCEINIVTELLNINKDVLEFALCYKEVKAVNEIYKITLFS